MASLRIHLALLVLGGQGVMSRDAGVLYEVWHTKAALAMQTVIAKGGPPLTVERVIRSNGNLTLDDVYKPYNVPESDIYNTEPAELGFYCLYRRRQGDANPPSPDCLNITQTASRHAKLLTEAGFDYVTVDLTNWPRNVSSTDVAVIRPTEVLFEEWYQLRQNGTATPMISTWPCSPNGSNTWQVLLDRIYNNATYADLIYKQDGKFVMSVPKNDHCYDLDVQAMIESNGGRNNIKVILMWALFGQPDYKADLWGFFSPCTFNGTDKYTTSMLTNAPCDQYSSVAADGSIDEISASSAYMLSQCSLPFASPGHMRGLTLQRLFTKVLAVGAPHLFFVSSFNELIGGRQAPATESNLGYNMGLPKDPQRTSVWVDTYGSEFSRDFEPNVESGDGMYQDSTDVKQTGQVLLTA